MPTNRLPCAKHRRKYFHSIQDLKNKAEKSGLKKNNQKLSKAKSTS